MTRYDTVAVSESKNQTRSMNMTSNLGILSQKPPPVPSKYISIPMCERQLLKDLDINGGSWVESMRASSPTHLKSTPSLNASDSLSLVSLIIYIFHLNLD